MTTIQPPIGTSPVFLGQQNQPSGAVPGLGRNVTLLAGIVTIWAARARQRRALAALDEETLESIGVDPAKALEEAAKPIWEG